MTLSPASQTRSNDKKLHFDPTRPRSIQIAKLLAQVFSFLGGIALALASMLLYPMLLTGQGYAMAYLGPVIISCGASFFIIRETWFPADMPLSARLQVRLGVGLCSALWLVGLFGIVNGYATPVAFEDAPIVYKRTSTPSDPKRMSYYVGARVWPSSQDVYEVIVSPALYASLDVPVVMQWRVPSQQVYAMPEHGRLHLAVGRGRLGVDWLRDLVETRP